MKWFPWIGPAIFVVSLALRLIGIGWGLPNSLHNESYHPDEPINFAASQTIEPARLSFTPGFYNYGTFYLTLAKIASGYCPGPVPDSEGSFEHWERCCLLAARIINALAGAGTAWVIFGILRRRTHLLGAAFGALAAGLAPAFVVHSRFATVDVTATFLFALSLFFALKLLPDQDGIQPSHYIRWALLAGLFAGLCAGTKYTGAVAIIGVLTAILFVRGSDRLRLGVYAVVATVLAFFISTPGVLFDTENFKRDFAYEMVHVASGHGLVFVNTPPAAMEHVISLSIGIGLLVFAMGIFGLVYALGKRYPWAVVVLGFALPYYLIISRGEVKFLRYTFPLYAPICVGFGWLVGQGHRRRDLKGRVAMGAAIIGLGVQAVGDNRYAFWMAGEDPRDQAGKFLKDLAKQHPGMTVGVTSDPWFDTPALYKDTAMSRPRFMRDGAAKMSEARDPMVVKFTPDQRPDYVTYSSLRSSDLDRLQNATNLSNDVRALVDQWKATMARLNAEYKPAFRFGDYRPNIYREDLEYVHPYVLVWKRKDLP